MIFIVIILSLLLIIAVAKWIKWRIGTLSMIYYIEKSGYKQPSDQEIADCTRYVANHLFK